MTEKQLRESLRDYLAPAGLPDSRREALLARIHAEEAPAPAKGEPNMFRLNKFRTVLVVAAIVTVLSFTVALAAGLSGYVNIKGEPVEAPTYIGHYPDPTPVTSPDDPRVVMERLINESPDDVLTIVSYLHSGGRDNDNSPVRVELSSIEQLAEYLPEGIPLPRIPEGFSFLSGHAILICAGDSDYEQVDKGTYNNGVSFYQYRIPEGKAVINGASIMLWDGQPGGQALGLLIALNAGTYGTFPVEEGDAMEILTLPGMDDALYLHHPDTGIHSVYARVLLDPPLMAWPNPYNPDIMGSYFEHPTAHKEVFYALTAWDSIPRETLTSMFR